MFSPAEGCPVAVDPDGTAATRRNGGVSYQFFHALHERGASRTIHPTPTPPVVLMYFGHHNQQVYIVQVGEYSSIQQAVRAT